MLDISEEKRCQLLECVDECVTGGAMADAAKLADLIIANSNVEAGTYKQRLSRLLEQNFEMMGFQTTGHFWCAVVPWLAEMALEVPAAVPVVEWNKPHDSSVEPRFGMAALRQNDEGIVWLTKLQVLQILAASFFGFIPEKRVDGDFPNYTFIELLCDLAKGSCLLSYFAQMHEIMQTLDHPALKERISFFRRPLNAEESFQRIRTSTSRIAPVSWEEGAIEDADGALQVDFADEYIGGLTLQMQSDVQEEIRFSICPELIVSMLIFEKLESHEAAYICGAERFSLHIGYDRTLTFVGPTSCVPAPSNGRHLGYHQRAPLDPYGRRDIQLAAYDAPSFEHRHLQYTKQSIDRDILKCLAGLSGDFSETHGSFPIRPVATGNWGCGVFGGDYTLKGLIQWIVSSSVGRPMRYFSFGDPEAEALRNVIHEVHAIDYKVAGGVSVANLYSILMQAAVEDGGQGNLHGRFAAALKQKFSCN